MILQNKKNIIQSRFTDTDPKNYDNYNTKQKTLSSDKKYDWEFATCNECKSLNKLGHLKKKVLRRNLVYYYLTALLLIMAEIIALNRSPHNEKLSHYYQIIKLLTSCIIAATLYYIPNYLFIITPTKTTDFIETIGGFVSKFVLFSSAMTTLPMFISSVFNMPSIYNLSSYISGSHSMIMLYLNWPEATTIHVINLHDKLDRHKHKIEQYDMLEEGLSILKVDDKIEYLHIDENDNVTFH